MYVRVSEVNYEIFQPPHTNHKDTVSVLGRDQGYTVKYNPLPEGVIEGKAQRNS